MMKKIAIFGSAFYPPHLGHLYLLKEVQKHFNFDKIKVIPTGQNPCSPKQALPPGRFELVQKVFKHVPSIEVEDIEINKKGPSWTIDTLKALMKEGHPTARFFILIGLDQWAQFDRWKSFKSLLKKAHIVIVHRKGYIWPEATPHFIKALLTTGCEAGFKKTFQLKKNHRTYGRDIYYCSLKPKDISSSQIRSLFEQGQPFDHLVPKGVCAWMKGLNQSGPRDKELREQDLKPATTNQSGPRDKEQALTLRRVPPVGQTLPLEKNVTPEVFSSYSQAQKHENQLVVQIEAKKSSPKYPPWITGALEILKAKQGQKIKVFDLRTKDPFPFDWTVVVSGSNSRHTKAMAEVLKKTLSKKFGLKILNREGLESGEWVVLDYGDIVFHIFYDYTREHYRLEELWQDSIYSRRTN